jgi:MFS family permease
MAVFRMRGGLRAHLPVGADYWRLWITGICLHTVRWIETIAFAIFVYQRTEAAFLVAMILMLRMLPMSLLGAFLGALTDRLDRRTGLLLMSLKMLVSSLVLLALAWSGRLEVWHLAVASFVNGIGWAADHPVRRMMIGEVIGLDRLNNAMSIEVAANQATRIVGPALAGIILAGFGLAGCFVLNIAISVVAIVTAFGLKYRNAPHAGTNGRLLSNIVEGFKAAHRDERLRGTLIVTIVSNIFGWPCTSMIPVIAQDNLHLSTTGIGLISSTDGVGALLCSLIIAVAARPQHYNPLYIGGLAGALITMILFAIAPSTVPAVAALFAMGVIGAGFTIMQATLVYMLITPEMRGRVLGLLSVSIGVGPIGFVLVGALAQFFGAQAAVIITSVAGLITLALLRSQWLMLLRKPA